MIWEGVAASGCSQNEAKPLLKSSLPRESAKQRCSRPGLMYLIIFPQTVASALLWARTTLDQIDAERLHLSAVAAAADLPTVRL